MWIDERSWNTLIPAGQSIGYNVYRRDAILSDSSPFCLSDVFHRTNCTKDPYVRIENCYFDICPVFFFFFSDVDRDERPPLICVERNFVLRDHSDYWMAPSPIYRFIVPK